MQATNTPPARQEGNMGDGPVNYNGLAAYHHNTASQPPQNQSAYGFTPMSAQQQPPHLPAPMQGGSGPTNGTQQAPQAASGPPSISLVEGNRKFSLQVVQQPMRARMCGFGDKDRRPITPPPCIRLIVTDAATGIEIDLNDIDHSMFVLNVDLWNDRGDREVNLVRHSATSPSISATIPVSYHDQNIIPAYQEPFVSGTVPLQSVQYSNANPYPSQQVAAPYGHPPQPYNPYNQPPQVNQYSQQLSGGQYPPQHPGQPPPQMYQYGHNNVPQGYPPPQAYQGDPNVPTVTGYFVSGPPPPTYGQPGPNGQRPSFSQPPHIPDMALARLPVSQTAPTGMFTRNLIGSLAASAFRLTDPGDRMGIWFVLQDLSVRTEGSFRLRLSFVNVGPPSVTPNGNPSNQNSILNTGRAPVLAACFSDVFTVYSAKKFPGVVESTALSKCFATQGIKIPIRKDGGSGAAAGGAGGVRAGDDED